MTNALDTVAAFCTFKQLLGFITELVVDIDEFLEWDEANDCDVAVITGIVLNVPGFDVVIWWIGELDFNSTIWLLVVVSSNKFGFSIVLVIVVVSVDVDGTDSEVDATKCLGDIDIEIVDVGCSPCCISFTDCSTSWDSFCCWLLVLLFNDAFFESIILIFIFKYELSSRCWFFFEDIWFPVSYSENKIK